VSFALGAFFAGVVLNESELSHKAAANSLPLQDAFAVLFFVSVGMLFDPGVLLRAPLQVLAVAGLILVGKSLVAFGIVLVLGYPVSTALVVSAALAQVGEFSFILAGLGITYQLLPAEGLNLILAGALISITLNPLVFALADRACAWLKADSGRRRRVNEYGAANLARLEADLEAVKEKVRAREAAHKTFTPEELVHRFPLFASLTAEQREVLILHFEPRTAQPGERIIRKGDAADAMYFIAEGEVEVAVGSRHFKLAAGDFFGEMALITGEPRSADVTALDFSKFATLSARDFRQFLKRYPDIRTRIAALAEERNAMNRAGGSEGEARA
jgi:CPA2 family monovalent cation:H+ antiporter-2